MLSYTIKSDKMKQKLSITIENELIKKLDETLKEGLFRNKSHIVEYALTKLLEGKE